MSSKTRTRTTDTTGSGSTLRSVPVQDTAATGRTDAEDKLWEALHANPNSTTADLSTAAVIGKSTAAKILAKWAAEGSVTRTPGIADGGRRAADVWVIAETEPVTAEPAGEDTRDNTDAPENAPAENVDLDDAGPASTDDAEPGGDATPEDAMETASGEVKEANAERLAPGALRGMVEDHLRDHPGDEFSPTAIAKALDGKSGGAVSNALDKLVTDGVAVKTQDKPRRFALAPAQQAAAAPPAN